MAEGRATPGSRLSSRRLTDYQERQRQLTEAFALPGDLRRWATVRVDDDEGTPDAVTLGVAAGRTVTLLTVEVPGEVRQALRALLKEHQDAMDSQLKMDLATNMLAMTLPPDEGAAE